MNNNKDIYQVKLSRQARKDLKKVPRYIAIKLWGWIDAIGHQGLNQIRKIPGFHDESLKGNRTGQRSIRLSKGYRAIYEIHRDGIKFVEIMEINKHEY